MTDLIDRQAAVEEFKTPGAVFTYGETTCRAIISRLMLVPPAQPERSEGRWIPITSRPMDTEERLEWSEKLGYDIEYNEALIYTSQLPDDGQEVLTCNRYGDITKDKFENDPDYGCSFEENGDMDGIVAWMPLPEPYKEGGASNE